MVFISKKPGICASNAAKHDQLFVVLSFHILLIKDCDTKIHKPDTPSLLNIHNPDVFLSNARLSLRSWV